MTIYTWLEKMQSLHKCVGVSGSVVHSLHNGSCGQFLFSKLFAVRIFLWRSVHAKNLHFGSALAFQIGIIPILLKVPSNWMLYALLAVYSPSDVHLHVMVSSLLLSSWMDCISSHSKTYSLISSCVNIGLICEIHLFPLSAWDTVIFFLFAFF